MKLRKSRFFQYPARFAALSISHLDDKSRYRSLSGAYAFLFWFDADPVVHCALQALLHMPGFIDCGLQFIPADCVFIRKEAFYVVNC